MYDYNISIGMNHSFHILSSLFNWFVSSVAFECTAIVFEYAKTLCFYFYFVCLFGFQFKWWLSKEHSVYLSKLFDSNLKEEEENNILKFIFPSEKLKNDWRFDSLHFVHWFALIFSYAIVMNLMFRSLTSSGVICWKSISRFCQM